MQTVQTRSQVTLEVSVLTAACTIREAFYFGHGGREILCLPLSGFDLKPVAPGERYRVTGRWSAQFFTCFEAEGIEAL